MNSLLSIVRWCCPERTKQDAISWIGFLQEFQYGNVSPGHNKQQNIGTLKNGDRWNNSELTSSHHHSLFGYGNIVWHHNHFTCARNSAGRVHPFIQFDISVKCFRCWKENSSSILGASAKDGVVGSNPTERTKHGWVIQ